MDDLYVALQLYKNRKFDKCIGKCTSLLEENPLDQAVWTLKMRALTRRDDVDDLAVEMECIENGVDSVWSETMATAPRLGTSLRHPIQSTTALQKPNTASYRPLTNRANTGRLRTAHTPGTARALLATAQARAVRLGTATMLTSQNSVAFVDPSKLNLSKYAQEVNVAKTLFNYLFYHNGDYRHAMELAVYAAKYSNFTDWWWKVALAKCYTMFNCPRDAEEQLKGVSRQHLHIDIFIRLIRNYIKLDQPTAGLEMCKEGLLAFPDDEQIMTEQARLLEMIGDSTQSVKIYRAIVVKDAMNIEAIGSIGINHFYNDQPEMALRYYRRILAMGTYTPEVFNNIALCCLRAQHWDLILTCYKRALLLATDLFVQAEVWYNLSHLALAIGDINLAIQCLRLCVNLDPSHASALNNLASLEKHMGHFSLARSLYTAALSIEPNLTEAAINLNEMNENYTSGNLE